MTDEEIVEQIPGARELFDRFGYWPSFHDAEVLSIALDREATSRVKIHAFRMTSAVESTGHYMCDTHTIVSFLLHEVSNCDLQGFNMQNVLSGLSIEKIDEGFALALGDCYGVAGSVRSKEMRIEFESGIPVASIYAEQAERIRTAGTSTVDMHGDSAA